MSRAHTRFLVPVVAAVLMSLGGAVAVSADPASLDLAGTCCWAAR
jgi:hypothetical protein